MEVIIKQEFIWNLLSRDKSKTSKKVRFYSVNLMVCYPDFIINTGSMWFEFKSHWMMCYKDLKAQTDLFNSHV